MQGLVAMEEIAAHWERYSSWHSRTSRTGTGREGGNHRNTLFRKMRPLYRLAGRPWEIEKEPGESEDPISSQLFGRFVRGTFDAVS